MNEITFGENSSMKAAVSLENGAGSERDGEEIDSMKLTNIWIGGSEYPWPFTIQKIARRNSLKVTNSTAIEELPTKYDLNW
jgi:hypothetical protein